MSTDASTDAPRIPLTAASETPNLLHLMFFGLVLGMVLAVPVGFLLEGGGVACVDSERMPEGLGEELENRGFGPQNPQCFGDDPPPACYLAPPLQNNGTNNTNNAANNTNNATNNGSNNATGPAFQTSNAEFIEYRTGPGVGYCVSEGDLLEFTVEVSTRTVSATVAVAGSVGEPSCLDEAAAECLVPHERTLELTEAELDGLLALMDAVPAPMCEVDPGLACDPCIVENLSDGSTSVAADCCGVQKAGGFDDAFRAVVDYMSDLVPGAFTANPSTFSTLTYAATPGDGYCIDAGNILSAALERQPDGSLSLSGEVAVAADAATETCIEAVTSGACLKAEAFGPQTLTPAAQDTLETLLGDVPEKMCLEQAGLAHLAGRPARPTRPRPRSPHRPVERWSGQGLPDRRRYRRAGPLRTPCPHLG